MVKRGKNSLGNRGNGKGFLAKLSSSSSSRRHGTEEGEGASAPVNSGGQGLDGGPEQGEKRGEGKVIRSPASPRAGAERGGWATRAGGGGRRWLRRRRCGLGRGAWEDGGACGGWGAAREPFYRASEAVEGGVRQWRLGGRCERINGVATRWRER